eukprot:TRINITY_DN83408_c0_g1_i1.p1 TRINITY_DN83408_c0_g1~~TRINITY_DN83408_c0_g1_i1.p1  ORF type:complete len:318 (+),score=76.42 TRINITY_DN83408_c0_g1_i1:78-1031(+)
MACDKEAHSEGLTSPTPPRRPVRGKLGPQPNGAAAVEVSLAAAAAAAAAARPQDFAQDDFGIFQNCEQAEEGEDTLGEQGCLPRVLDWHPSAAVEPQVHVPPAWSGSSASSRCDSGGYTASRRAACFDEAKAASQGSAICAAAEAGHVRIAQVLAKRLAALRALQAPWSSGDAALLAQGLEASKDDALTAALLNRLASHPGLLHPRALARLLPVVQRLAQVDCEDHAVAAMRFALHTLKVSWPTIAKSLRTVATSRPMMEACEDAASQLQALYSLVKAMARSVRISRNSNGPLVPLCRKLKASLEEALAKVGRLRGG